MAKALKLTGVNTYTSPLISNALLSKGMICLFNEEQAGYLQELSRPSMEDGIDIKFFTPDSSGRIDISFTTEEVVKAIESGVSGEQLQRLATVVAEKVEDSPAAAPSGAADAGVISDSGAGFQLGGTEAASETVTVEDSAPASISRPRQRQRAASATK